MNIKSCTMKNVYYSRNVNQGQWNKVPKDIDNQTKTHNTKSETSLTTESVNIFQSGWEILSLAQTCGFHKGGLGDGSRPVSQGQCPIPTPYRTIFMVSSLFLRCSVVEENRRKPDTIKGLKSLYSASRRVPTSFLCKENQVDPVLPYDGSPGGVFK